MSKLIDNVCLWQKKLNFHFFYFPIFRFCPEHWTGNWGQKTKESSFFRGRCKNRSQGRTKKVSHRAFRVSSVNWKFHNDKHDLGFWILKLVYFASYPWGWRLGHGSLRPWPHRNRVRVGVSFCISQNGLRSRMHPLICLSVWSPPLKCNCAKLVTTRKRTRPVCAWLQGFVFFYSVWCPQNPGPDPGFWSRGALNPKFAQNNGFSLTNVWKLHGFEKILGARGARAIFERDRGTGNFCLSVHLGK